jgi:hypothetical protein
MPAAASKTHRRRKEGAPVFHRCPPKLSGARAARTWKFTMSGTSPACKGKRRAEQAYGIWLLESDHPPPAPPRPCKTKYCGRQAPAVATLMLAFAIRVLGNLLTDGMNALRGPKVPACLHAKLHTTARKPERVAYPARMLKLRRTHEFPAFVHIEPVKKICGYSNRQTMTQQPPRGRAVRAGDPTRTIQPRHRPQSTIMSYRSTTCRHPDERATDPDHTKSTIAPNAMCTPRCTSGPSCP